MAKNAEYDSAWCANHEKLYLWKSKNQFLRSKFFCRKLKLIKFLWNWKMELAKNKEYDSGWCANHEKLYLSPSINQILGSKFFRLKFRWKKFLWNWNIEFSKIFFTSNSDQKISLNLKNRIG